MGLGLGIVYIIDVVSIVLLFYPIVLKSLIPSPKICLLCPQQTFRFIKNGHLQFSVFQKVWYIAVTKSIKLKKFFCQIFILWILEVYDVTEVKKDPKTHEN